jgi:hypothetical protein
LWLPPDRDRMADVRVGFPNIVTRTRMMTRCVLFAIILTSPHASGADKHGVTGPAGAFYMTVWTDVDGDGLPDTEFARSKKMIGTSRDLWSAFEFTSKSPRIYVGNFWEHPKTIVCYTKTVPPRYVGLSETVHYSTNLGRPPHSRAVPRVSNVRVQRLAQ